jgi:ABC-type proline/glycine betaine transport system permease subunit
MPSRRKRGRGSRHAAADGRRASHPAPGPGKAGTAGKAGKGAVRRREQYLATTARLRRLRVAILAVGFVPLAGVLGCGTLGIGVACAVPRDWYFALWAAVIGSIVGLTIRLVLERRRFEHGTGVGP